MSEICLVIPCYNEEHRLDGKAILDYLGTHDRCSICFVNDGSSDGSLALLETLRQSAPANVLVLSLAANAGKAEAVRQGMLQAATTGRFAFVRNWDADLSTPLEAVEQMLDVFEREPSSGIVMGSRIRRLGARIDRNGMRHYLGRLFATSASGLLSLPVYDSQCGAKIIRADLIEVLFRNRFLTSWLFDVEILARLRNHLGREGILESVTEIPLKTWNEVGGSKLRLSHMARVPVELMRIARHYNRKPSKRMAPAASYHAPRP